MYDIYLYTGCDRQPTATDLGQHSQALELSSIQSRLREKEPGFLDLQLAPDVAQALATQLRVLGARGYALPAAYRWPLVTLDQARLIAETYLVDIWVKEYSSYTFEPMCFVYDDPMRWVFRSHITELVAQGMVPGALFAVVDKLDGHIWQDGESERYFEGQ